MSDRCCGGQSDRRHHRGTRLSWLGMFAPVLACAFCPACLTLYASLLSAVGVGITFTEADHHALLGAAVVSCIVVAAWRSRREQTIVPLAVGGLGCSVLVLGHVGERAWIEWIGIVVLLTGAWFVDAVRGHRLTLIRRERPLAGTDDLRVLTGTGLEAPGACVHGAQHAILVEAARRAAVHTPESGETCEQD
jgi:hypothetical protein